MIFTPGELTGKSLDWAYELAHNIDATDMRVFQGTIQIYIYDVDSEYLGSGWYNYKRRLTNEDEARKLVAEKLGAFIIVPTDLGSPRWADRTH